MRSMRGGSEAGNDTWPSESSSYLLGSLTRSWPRQREDHQQPPPQPQAGRRAPLGGLPQSIRSTTMMERPHALAARPGEGRRRGGQRRDIASSLDAPGATGVRCTRESARKTGIRQGPRKSALEGVATGSCSSVHPGCCAQRPARAGCCFPVLPGRRPALAAVQRPAPFRSDDCTTAADGGLTAGGGLTASGGITPPSLPVAALRPNGHASSPSHGAIIGARGEPYSCI